MTRRSIPPARGVRRTWQELPLRVQVRLEARIGSPVVKAWSRSHGFSPALASVLRLRNGERIFVKAVGPRPNPEAVELFRQEARMAHRLPSSAPAPRFLWSDEFDGWVALAYAEAPGRTPRIPWRRPELACVLDALVGLARIRVPRSARLRPFRRRIGPLLAGWKAADRAGRSLPAIHPRDQPWVDAHRADLLRWEGEWPRWSAGTALVHCDVRADNVLLDGDRVTFVDWTAPCLGAPWVDLALFLPSVAMQGGPAPWTIFPRHPLGRSVSRAAIRSMVTAFTGFLLDRASRPPPPGLPTLRPFQAGQAIPALAWLRRLADD